MRRHIGDFGVVREPVDEVFGWFGAEIRVNPDLTDLAVLDLVGLMGNMDDGNGAIEAIRSMGSVLVHPEDLDEFWGLARSNRQTMEDIGVLATHLIGALAERPTRLPSGSSDGQQSTDVSSTGSSSSQALRVLEDRPDLAVAVLRAG